MGDANPICTLRDYSKPSHKGCRNTIELPIGNNVDPSPHGRILLLIFLLNSFHREGLQNSTTISRCSNNIKENLSQDEIDRAAGGKLRDKNADEYWEIIENLTLYDHEAWNDLKNFIKPPQALGTTFEARVHDYMAAHTESMERFENAIFKHQEEINDRMAKMFGLLKELTTSRAHEKVLISEEAKSTITKNVNSISLTRGEEEKSDKDDVATGDGIEKANGSDIKTRVKEA
nr:MAK10-like protein [Tanacetum cinerariifolium]